MGLSNQVGIGLQPKDGQGRVQQKVAATAATTFLPLQEASLTPDISTLEHVAMEGNRFPKRQKRGGREFGGNINGGFRPVSTGLLLSMLLGEPVTTSLEAGPPEVFEHVWTPISAGSVPMPATVWTIQNDIYEQTGLVADKVVDQFLGVVLNEMSWSVEGNEYFLFESDAMALRQIEDVAAPVSTLDASELWSFDEVGMQMAVPGIAAGAYQDIAIYDWGFSYSNDFQGSDRFPVGSKEAVALRPGNVESEIEMTIAENLELEYRRAISDFPDLVKVKLDAVGAQIYEGTPDLFESLTIEFFGVEYRSGERPMTAEDIWEDVEVTAGVVKNNANQFLKITLVNKDDGEKYLAE